jgi:hypothetical protein
LSGFEGLVVGDVGAQCTFGHAARCLNRLSDQLLE